MQILELIIGTLLAVLGVYGMSGLVIALWLGRSSRRWPTTAGEVLDARAVRDVGSRGSSFYATPKIRFRYRVDNREYASDNITYDVWSPEIDAVQQVVDRYKTGSHVQVYYDPRRPSRAVLEPGRRWRTFLLPMIIISWILILGIGLILSHVLPHGI